MCGWQVQVQVKLERSKLQGKVKCANSKCKSASEIGAQ